MPQQKDEEINELAEEITRYLQSREHMADTIEGIAKWWMLRLRLQEETTRVEKAVNVLHDKGLIQKRVLPDGTVLYSSMKCGDINQ